MSLVPNGHWIFAQRRLDRSWVGVLEVANGLNCDCVCPECGTALLARQGPVRSPHFSHPAQNASCGMGLWHTLIRDSIADLKQIDLGRDTPVPRMCGNHRIVRADCEQPVLDNEFKLDVLLWLQSGLKIAVEVVDTSDISGVKFVALEQEGFQVLRIDVAAVRAAMGDRPATVENLKALLASRGGWQSWPHISEEPVQESLALLPSSWPESFWLTIRSYLRGLQSTKTAWSISGQAKGGNR